MMNSRVSRSDAESRQGSFLSSTFVLLHTAKQAVMDGKGHDYWGLLALNTHKALEASAVHSGERFISSVSKYTT